jgi:hypothetical protein
MALVFTNQNHESEDSHNKSLKDYVGGNGLIACFNDYPSNPINRLILMKTINRNMDKSKTKPLKIANPKIATAPTIPVAWPMTGIAGSRQ